MELGSQLREVTEEEKEALEDCMDPVQVRAVRISDRARIRRLHRRLTSSAVRTVFSGPVGLSISWLLHIAGVGQ